MAKEFPSTGIDTSQNGLSFNGSDELWNIDTARRHGQDAVTQVAYLLDPSTGQPLRTVALSPPTPAALGDFSPVNDLYYGLNFTSFSTAPTFIVVVNVQTGSATTLAQTVANLHTLAFIKK